MKFFILYLSLSLYAIGAEVLKLGILPHMSSTRLQAIYSPLRVKLTQVLDTKVSMHTTKGFKDYTKALDNGVYDIALIQPFDYPWLHKKHMYIPLARRDTPLEALVVVKDNSVYKNINDLKNKRISVIAQTAAVIQIFHHELKAKEIDVDKEFNFIPANNHFTCMQMVLLDKVEACVTLDKAKSWFELQKKMRPFKVVFRSQVYPHTLFVIHPRVSLEQRNKIQKVLLKWDDRPSHIRSKNLDKSVFVIAKDSDYDVVRNVLKESK